MFTSHSTATKYSEDASRQGTARRLPIPQGMVAIGYDGDRFQRDKVQEAVGWHPELVANHHFGMVGLSGSGKTHQLRNLIASLPPDVEVDVLDWHGDIELDEGPDYACANFSQNTKFGYNPLILNSDPEYGGIRRGVSDLIDAINNTSSKLGVKQEYVLRNLLYDTYAKFGIYPDQPSTWSRKILNAGQIAKLRSEGNEEIIYSSTYPTIEDVHEFGMKKLQSMWLGANDDDPNANRAIVAIDELGKVISRLDTVNIKIAQMERVSDTDFEELASLKTNRDKLTVKSKEVFEEYLHNMRTGREFHEHVKYQSKDTILSVLTRLDNLIATGIFSQNPPPFGRARVRRYFLRPLATSPDELSMFIRFRLKAIIRSMMQEGHVDGRLRRIIVLDEASQFADDNPENPINVIATQMRKFGLGLVLASQSISHFSQDFIQNAATILLLALAPSDYDNTARQLRVEKQLLGYLMPRKTALIRQTEVGKTPRVRKIILPQN